MKKYLLSLLAVFAFIAPAHAQVEQYSFDPVHTQIFFSVNHLGYTDSFGRFLKFDGGITWDRTKTEESSVNVTIDTNSLEMNDDKWNTHLKSQDFFDVTKYPTMTFKSTKVEKTGEKTGKITGDLTMHGVTKPVTLDVVFNNAGKHPMMDEYHAGFTASAMLKRSDFGINFGIPMVGDDVKLMINVEAVRKESGQTGVKNP